MLEPARTSVDNGAQRRTLRGCRQNTGLTDQRWRVGPEKQKAERTGSAFFSTLNSSIRLLSRETGQFPELSFRFRSNHLEEKCAFWGLDNKNERSGEVPERDHN